MSGQARAPILEMARAAPLTDGNRTDIILWPLSLTDDMKRAGCLLNTRPDSRTADLS